jgi:hypothetical protein
MTDAGAMMSREEIAVFLASLKKLRGGLVVVQFECCASMKLARWARQRRAR